MAIEFNCPYCTAAIRVPDELSGKRGSCPKCATKLLVPDVVPKTATPAAPEQTSPVVAAPPAVPAFPPAPANPAEVVPGQVPATAPAPEFAPPPPTTSFSKKLKRKSRRRKSQGVYGLAVPAICFLLFFGAVASLLYFRTPDLTGSLKGTVVGEMDLSPAKVSLHNLTLTDREITDAALAFEGATETFVSAQMSCSIGVDGDNLIVDVRSGNGFDWYAVNPATNVTLSDWIRSSRTALNAHRLKMMAATGAELCKDKVVKQGGTPLVFDAVKYRDHFGLSAHVDAFGYVVEALAGNKLTPCAHEDSNGTLYFALPVGTKTFQLRGREFGGQKLFPGEYTVKVEGVAAAEPAPAKDTPEPAAPADGEEPEGDWDPNKPDDDSEMNASEPMDAV